MLYRRMRTRWPQFFLTCAGLALLAAACGPPAQTPTPAASPTAPPPWTDERAVMAGICFEAARDAAGRVFTLRSAEDHIRFYDLADNSHLCRHPVERHPFDFAGGRVLAGLWSAGQGCAARHDLLSFERDDAARAISIRLALVLEGDCPYELVRPFWVGLEAAQGYTITIAVQERAGLG